jgi:hypothetical protein
MLKAEVKNDLLKDGFQILFGIVSAAESNALASELSLLFEQQQSSVKSKIGGVRNLLRNPNVIRVALSPAFKSLVGENLFPVRAIFFDKTAESNWRVPWHQDLAIAVAERIETEGFNAWSLKDGVVHVQPPLEFLEKMVAVRLHLDDCNADNGALKVIPGTHKAGKLDAPQIAERVEQSPATICDVSKGGVLLMRPLLLHSSSPAKTPVHRRVLHIEYAADRLPNGLRWLEEAGGQTS